MYVFNVCTNYRGWLGVDRRGVFSCFLFYKSRCFSSNPFRKNRKKKSLKSDLFTFNKSDRAFECLIYFYCNSDIGLSSCAKLTKLTSYKILLLNKTGPAKSYTGVLYRH